MAFQHQTLKTYVSCAYSFRPSAQSMGDRATELWGAEGTANEVGQNLAIETSYPVEDLPSSTDYKALVKSFDHVHLTAADHGPLRGQIPSLENIGLKVAETLKGGPTFRRTRVAKGDIEWVDVNAGSNRVRVTRVFTISCLHRHHNPDLSQEENEQLYTKCSRTHGHEYKIELTLEGEVDDETGTLYKYAWLDSLMNKQVIEPLHGSYLNDHLGNTSGEIILEKLRLRLEPFIPTHLDLSLRLRETRKNSFLSYNYPLHSI